MIKEFEFYHGAVLAKLIHGRNTCVSIRPYSSNSNAAYVIDETVAIYVKHSAKRMSPWLFSLQNDHQKEIGQLKSKWRDVFLVLVCGDDGVAALSYDEIEFVIGNNAKAKWISAGRAPGKEYSVKGPAGLLHHKVGKKGFPRKILRALSDNK
jgi:hypothetical protein